MSRSSDDKIIESIRLYRAALKETQALYIESGQLVRGSYGWLAGGDDADAASIAGQMDDLHQGFLMKVFAAPLISIGLIPETSSDLPSGLQVPSMKRMPSFLRIRIVMRPFFPTRIAKPL